MDVTPTHERALARLAQFLPAAGRRYAETRNHDDGPVAGGRGDVSQLTPWLHAGVITETEVLDVVLRQHSPAAAEKFIAEVFWRIYFSCYCMMRPRITPRSPRSPCPPRPRW